MRIPKHAIEFYSHTYNAFRFHVTVPVRITFLGSKEPVDGYAILNQSKAMVGIRYGNIQYLGTVWFDKYKIKTVTRAESHEVLYTHEVLL